MAKETLGNEQAFASIAVDKDRTYGDPGLTKREYFAAIALQGMLASNMNACYEEFAKRSVDCADALIDALNK
jgi:hypothetical protein